MSSTYFKFLFITTIKKRPVWITWLIFLLTCSAFLLILPGAARINTIQIWANTTMAICESFLGMAAAIFTSILAIHVFKDGNEEGTELVVFSKPISRIQITLTKFFVFGAFCLLVNVTAVALTSFTIFLPKTETQFYWKLLVSMFIGNTVTFGVFGSLAILMTVKFAKAGVIIGNVMISLIFIIYQILTLFTFSTPSKSLLDHGMGATTYILVDRDMDTGEYKEDEVVNLHTNSTNITHDNPNYSIDWEGMRDYWLHEVNKKNVVPALNATDFAGQVALTYLSVGLDQYAFRQARRNFAFSRYYNYKLTNPASPELLDTDPNAKKLHWMYTSTTSEEVGKMPITEVPIEVIRPSYITFAGIPPIGSTRLAGYGDKIPIGNYIKTGELLSFKDVYFEPSQWKKYIKPFQIMYENIFKPEYYIELVPSYKYDYYYYPSLFNKSNAALSHYYQLVWSCLTGNSEKEEYLGPNNPMKDYDMNYFDIKTVSDLNERFIQFKYYTFLLAQKEQEEILNGSHTIDTEKQAKIDVFNDYDESQMPYIDALGKFVYSNDNWFAESDPDTTIPYIQPNSHAPAITYMAETYKFIERKAKDEEWSEDMKKQVFTACTRPQFNKTIDIVHTCSLADEEFLFASLTEPVRSAEYHGKAYFATTKWVPYTTTLLAEASRILGLPIASAEGHNLEWFFFTTTPTRKYWMYAIIWGVLSLLALSAGVVVYQKYDVK